MSYKDLSPENLIRLIQQCLDEGKFREVLGLHRFLKTMSIRENAVPFVSHDFIARISGFREWCERNQAKYDYYTFGDSFLQHAYLDGLPECMTGIYRNSRGHTHEVFLAQAQNIRVMQWVFPGGDEDFAVFSSRGDYLYDDYYDRVFWLPYMAGNRYLRFLANDRKHGLIDFYEYEKSLKRIAGPCVFLGSRSNYGHWLLDFVTRLWVVDKYPEIKKLPLVVGRLAPFQKELLHILGFDNELIELSPAAGSHYGIFAIDQAYIPGTPPLPVGKTFLKDKTDKYFRNRKPLERRKGIYLSRRNSRPRHRIENDEEISEFLADRGFDILFAEQLSVEDTVRYCKEARIVVTTSGAQSSNIILSDDFVFINLLPENLPDWPINYVRAVTDYCFSIVEHFIPVWGKIAGKASCCIDTPALIDLRDLEAALARAEILLEESALANGSSTTPLSGELPCMY